MAESDLIRGNVDTVILKVLYEGDRYGYDLIKQINARGDGQWEIKQPTVYACLKRLEKQGFVTSYWDSSESDGGRRKYYSLTESGKDVFIRYKNEFERATALFGGIISGSDNLFIQPADDYSDVEDEGYSVPKRRSVKKRDKKREPVSEQAETATGFADSQPIDDATAYKAPEHAEPTEAPQDLFSYGDGYAESNAAPRQEYAQQNLFAYADQIEQPSPAQEREQPREQAVIEEPPATRTALDPRSIIDRYYASETGESYSDVHGKTVYNVAQESAPVTAQTPAPAPAASVAPAPVKSAPPAEVAENVKQPATAARDNAVAVKENAPVAFGFEQDDESEARKAYKTVLSDLVERFEVAPPDVKADAYDNRAQEQAAVGSAVRENPEEKRFIKVTQTARSMGNEVTVRNHNDSAKQYAHKYYYYGNRLMMTHYTIMCAAMFIIGLTLFLTFYLGLGMRMRYDYLLYVGAGLLPIIMFITAVGRFAANPDKKNRINVNFRFSTIIRCIIMLQVAVVVYCLNLIWGMPVGFSQAYIPSLIIPLAYALFIPLSEVIYMSLLKSERYAVE